MKANKIFKSVGSMIMALALVAVMAPATLLQSFADEAALDPSNLADGKYTVQGKMIKVDKKSDSMSNNAIDHEIVIDVKGGAPTVHMKFIPMNLMGKKGYLGTLKYFLTGFTLEPSGRPTGATAVANTDSYHMDGDKPVKDELGGPYPHEVSYPLVEEAKTNEGWVPLQVFVPVMESIGAGLGTQEVFLKLDWTTLKLVEKYEDENAVVSAELEKVIASADEALKGDTSKYDTAKVEALKTAKAEAEKVAADAKANVEAKKAEIAKLNKAKEEMLASKKTTEDNTKPAPSPIPSGPADIGKNTIDKKAPVVENKLAQKPSLNNSLNAKKAPKTGDNQALGMYAGMMALAAVSLIAIYGRKENELN